jgi:hypothetical protein
LSFQDEASGSVELAARDFLLTMQTKKPHGVNVRKFNPVGVQKITANSYYFIVINNRL